MSLLSPSLSGPRIALLPGRAGLAAAGPARVAAHPEAGWNGALRALEDLLGQGKAGGRAQVILSHHFVRLFLLDPPPAWLNDREMPAWIADRLAEPLGGTTGWRFAWDATPPGAAIPVAALEEVPLAQLAEILGRHGLTLGGLRPWLTAAWANRRRGLSRGNGWYGLLEPGRLTLARLDAGRLRGVRQRQMGDDPVAELRDVLVREAMLGEAGDQGALWLEQAGVGGDWSGLGPYRVAVLSQQPDAARGLLQ